MAGGRSGPTRGSPITRAVVAAVTVLALAVTGAGGPTEPRLSLSPSRDFAGAPVNAQASGFLPYEALSWRWDGDPIRGSESADRADTGGFAWTTLWVPDDAEPGPHEVIVTGESGSSASATFTVDPRTEETVYRLPSSTTSTTTAPARGAAPAADTPAEPEPASPRSASTRAPTTTTRAEHDVPDRFGVSLEDPGGGGGGPPSWFPALGPAAIIALFGGRVFIRHLTREESSKNPANTLDT